MIERYGDVLDILIDNVYNQNCNYHVINADSEEDICYIFFSSHGIYYPDTSEVFKKRIIDENHYDWLNLVNIDKFSKRKFKCIFVRDLYKCWYSMGISSNCNSMSSLTNLLEMLTSGKKIITVGCSAGGYAAIYYGTILKATKILTFFPQVDLCVYRKFHDDPFYEKVIGRQDNLSVVNNLKKYDGNLYIFWPKYSEEDIAQVACVDGIENTHSIPIKEKQHGFVMYPENMIDIILADSEKLNQICRSSSKGVTKERLMFHSMSFLNALHILYRHKRNEFKKRRELYGK